MSWDMQLSNDNVESYKSHYDCLWRRKHKQSFSSVSGELTTLGVFLLK